MNADKTGGRTGERITTKENNDWSSRCSKIDVQIKFQKYRRDNSEWRNMAGRKEKIPCSFVNQKSEGCLCDFYGFR